VVGDAFLLDADVGRSVIALVLAAFATFQTEILEVIDVAGVDEFGGFTGRPAIVLAQPALERDVVVLHGAANKFPLV